MKTIVHIASHTTNIGDGALVRGIQSTLPEDIAVQIEFINHCLTDFFTYDKLRFDQEYVDWINDNADMLLIGGGGFITAEGFSLQFDLDLLQKIRVPIVVYAIGYNLFFGEALENASAISILITRIRELGGLFSLRNDGSVERLQKDVGSAVAESVREIPDPGLFVPATPMVHPQIRGGKRNIVLQLAGDKLTNRLISGGKSSVAFGAPQTKRQKKNISQSDFVCDAIANVCNKVGMTPDINFVIAPHIYSDLDITKNFVSAARKISAPRYLAGSRLEIAGVLRGTQHASGYFDLYRQADFVIGMRGHSMIVSVGVGTPCVGVVSHPKVEGFLKDCCLEKWSTNVVDANFEDSLFEKISMLLDDSSEWRTLRAIAVEKMVQTRKQFHSDIKALLD